jgi:hypothetical protein
MSFNDLMQQTLFLNSTANNSTNITNADDDAAGHDWHLAMTHNHQHQSATTAATTTSSKDGTTNAGGNRKKLLYPHATCNDDVPVKFGLRHGLFTINGIKASVKQCYTSKDFAKEKIRGVWYVISSIANLHRAREIREEGHEITEEDCNKFLEDFHKW